MCHRHPRYGPMVVLREAGSMIVRHRMRGRQSTQRRPIFVRNAGASATHDGRVELQEDGLPWRLCHSVVAVAFAVLGVGIQPLSYIAERFLTTCVVVRLVVAARI